MNRQPRPLFEDRIERAKADSFGRTWLAVVVLSVFASTTGRSDETDSSRPANESTVDVNFVRDIQPLLVKHCTGCHGRDKRESGLRLDSRADALLGSDSGRVIVSGKSDQSLLVQRVMSTDPDERMPPDQPLSAAQVRLLSAWIDQGAEWPETAMANKAARKHWSFQPIQSAVPPAVHDAAWTRNAIDRFVLARLEQAGIKPSPEADRRVLIRRLSLDLTGLPPTPEAVVEFVADTRVDAYERLVDRLLSSPHFGECWALHWLDLARYADSDGYEMDHYRPHAWRWRDWVIGAINRDLPFDQFTVQQLAGDLLPQATFEQRVATGFHRNSLTNRENGIDQEEFRLKAVVDRVSTTGTVWLGLTLGCAECHSHKYDPISQREYYQFFAFFNDQVDEADLPIAGSKDAVVHAFAARDKPRVTRIHLRGNFLDQGDAVQPDTPALLPPLPPRQRPEGRPADRLDLARWLIHPTNPLTARVEVNRTWQHLFGTGLVRSEDDFGIQGQPPTHPELLDWLADELIRCGWSRKQLIRRVVTSAAYRQVSEHRADLADRDPLNTLLARQNRFRLEAESLRDQYLAVSGLLNPRVGGPSFRPPLPDSLARIGFRLSWQPASGADLYRRSMYITFMRNMAYPMLTTFDRSNANVTCTRRERSNTPLQPLTQLNDPLFMESYRALGWQLLREVQSDNQRLDELFERATARLPASSERAVLLRLQAELVRMYRSNAQLAKAMAGEVTLGESIAEAAAWIAVVRTVLNLDEFITRE